MEQRAQWGYDAIECILQHCPFLFGDKFNSGTGQSWQLTVLVFHTTGTTLKPPSDFLYKKISLAQFGFMEHFDFTINLVPSLKSQ